LTFCLGYVLVLFMSDSAEKAERQDRILGELAELGLSLARAVHERALAAETPEATSELALAFHRISRSVRQTLALEAKIEHDRSRQDREVRADAARGRENGVTRRKHQLRMAVERSVWNEAEGAEAERLLDELDDILEEEVLSDAFTEGPLEAHIARIRADLGLAANDTPLLPRPKEDGGGGSARSDETEGAREGPGSAQDTPARPPPLRGAGWLS
jgi:hypothetical protein